MTALQRLREVYASADFATQFLEAAIRKADVNLITEQKIDPLLTIFNPPATQPQAPTPPPDADINTYSYMTSTGPDLVPDSTNLESITTPPASLENESAPQEPAVGQSGLDFMTFTQDTLDNSKPLDFDALINFDETLEGGVDMSLGTRGENGGFMIDVDWMPDERGGAGGGTRQQRLDTKTAHQEHFEPERQYGEDQERNIRGYAIAASYDDE